MAKRIAGFLVLVALAAAQNVAVEPSNATLPSSLTDTDMVMNIKANAAGLTLSQTNFTVVPLTPHAGASQRANVLANVVITGLLQSTDSTNAGQVNSTIIAYINCDPVSNSSDSDPSSVLNTATGLTPRAIVLYSLFSAECNLTSSYTASYSTLYSMTSKDQSTSLFTELRDNSAGPGGISGQISSSAASTDNNNGGPAPTTAVAMSILYSITGIITLLFLIIIGTGAIRAHRHPERYGPRSGIAGRPRQSRAKGLARAMLETLPIVKFGDPQPEKPGAHDIEMDGPPTENQTQGSGHDSGAAEMTTKGPTAAEAEAGMSPSMQSESEKPKESAVQNEEQLGCSICTEDFTTGEDVRVLPCQHKYHPACIDPWLLNVSGTCPLCRHDLRPSRSRNTQGDDEAISPVSPDGDGLAPPLGEPQNGNVNGENGESSTRNRRSRFLDLYGLRHAPPSERIAALRELRQRSQQDAEGSGDTEDRRRSRLTARLRDTFRARPRSQVDTDGTGHEDSR